MAASAFSTFGDLCRWSLSPACILVDGNAPDFHPPSAVAAEGEVFAVGRPDRIPICCMSSVTFTASVLAENLVSGCFGIDVPKRTQGNLSFAKIPLAGNNKH